MSTVLPVQPPTSNALRSHHGERASSEVELFFRVEIVPGDPELVPGIGDRNGVDESCFWSELGGYLGDWGAEGRGGRSERVELKNESAPQVFVV